MGLFDGGKIKELESRIGQLQQAVEDSVSIIASTRRRESGNPYGSQEQQVNELIRKHDGLAEWGCQAVRNIVAVRAVFTLGTGISVAPRDGAWAEREVAFAEEFFAANGLDETVPMDWAREGELEGRFLARLIWDPLRRLPIARQIPWSETKYTVARKPDDYYSLDSVSWTTQSGKTMLPADECVYAKFGGRPTAPNVTPPRIGIILKQCEDLDKCLWDWRRINHLHGSPTPYFKTATQEEANEISAKLKSVNWTIGKAFASTADYSLVGPPERWMESIEKEITFIVKIISGSTGVPVHFLGLPDLLSNRATADNLLELITTAVAQERAVWLGFYNELIRKAILMANALGARALNPDALVVSIPETSSAKMAELKDTWLPLYTAGAIDFETLLARVPDVDAAAVAKRVLERKAEAAKQFEAKPQEEPPK